MACITGALIWWRMLQPPELPEAPAVTFVDRSMSPPLKTLISLEETVYVCSNGKCTAAPMPPADTKPMTDGQWWYYYSSASEKIYLRRENPTTGERHTVMESTPLTSPRGLYVSPNGQDVAFWLDNINKPEEELTELWVYDVAGGGIRLVAEKVYRPDVRSEVFWNTQATHLWFVADTGERSLPHDVLELIVIQADSPGQRTAFPDVPWSDLLKDISAAAVDLSQRADKLVYTTTNFFGRPILMVHTPADQQRTNVRGDIKFTQWLEDGSMLYALQDTRGFTFWRLRDGVHRLVARRTGQLLAARGDSAGEQIVFITAGKEKSFLSSLQIATGRVRQEGVLPTAEAAASIVWVEQLPSEPETLRREIASELIDEEVAAFIEKNFAEVVGDQAGQPLRLVITSEPNAVFLDYRGSAGEERRLLVKIHDAVNIDWSIKARYEPVNREWKKVLGGGLADPQPTRLYEWENSLQQWVLKASL